MSAAWPIVPLWPQQTFCPTFSPKSPAQPAAGWGALSPPSSPTPGPDWYRRPYAAAFVRVRFARTPSTNMWRSRLPLSAAGSAAIQTPSPRQPSPPAEEPHGFHPVTGSPPCTVHDPAPLAQRQTTACPCSAGVCSSDSRSPPGGTRWGPSASSTTTSTDPTAARSDATRAAAAESVPTTAASPPPLPPGC
jgi:hypothetical protein